MCQPKYLAITILIAVLNSACTQEASGPGPAYLENHPELATLKSSNSGRISAQVSVAESYMTQHRFADAATLLRSALAQMNRKGPDAQPNRRTAIQMDLAEALAYARDEASLKALVNISLAETSAREGFQTPRLASAQAQAAELLWIGGDRAGAQALLEQAMANLAEWGSSQNSQRRRMEAQMAAMQADPLPPIPTDRSDFYSRCEAVPTGADQAQLEALFADAVIADNVLPRKTELHPGPATTTIRVNPEDREQQPSCEFSLQQGRIIAARTY